MRLAAATTNHPLGLTSTPARKRLKPPLQFVSEFYNVRVTRLPHMQSSWHSIDLDLRKLKFADRIRDLIYINSYGGFYIFRHFELREAIILPKINGILPKSVRMAFQVHEDVHHLQSGSNAVGNISNTEKSDQQRAVARAAMEGPAVYCQDAYIAQFCSKLDLFLWKLANKLINVGLKFLSMFVRKSEPTPSDTITEDEVYSLGRELAARVAERTSPLRMLEILSSHPPLSLAELLDPEIYLEKLKSQKLIV